MPEVTKYDVVVVECQFIKKLIERKGKLSINDITEFREAYNKVKFNKKQINTSLSALAS